VNTGVNHAAPAYAERADLGPGVLHTPHAPGTHPT
jgi:hypothetical protein